MLMEWDIKYLIQCIRLDLWLTRVEIPLLGLRSHLGSGIKARINLMDDLSISQTLR